MKLTNEQLERIQEYLDLQGMQDSSLQSDLLDHLICKTEDLIEQGGLSFEQAFTLAKSQIMPNGPQEFERDLKLLTTYKPNIIMRKIAYIGGYLSALCLCLSVLFFTLSSLTNKKTAMKVAAMQQEWRMQHKSFELWTDSEAEKEMLTLENTMYVKSYNKYAAGETLLIVSIFLLITTFLPYQFYSKYQKHNLEVAQV